MNEHSSPVLDPTPLEVFEQNAKRLVQLTGLIEKITLNYCTFFCCPLLLLLPVREPLPGPGGGDLDDDIDE